MRNGLVDDSKRHREVENAERLKRDDQRNGLHLVDLRGLRGGTVDQAKADLKTESGDNSYEIRTIRGFHLDPSGDPVADRLLGPMIVTAVCLDEYTTPTPTLYVGVVGAEQFTGEVRDAVSSRSQANDERLVDVSGCKKSGATAIYVKN